ncbi:uncharacterized protein BDR25DRAFT_36704 [Lindgomyces ingoldianus]|uniref:Uncharacterized protein n=1 Tax=Lindgomyces ingoldianus TaxID=673940 RepID=A0ACB6QV20_9PLEO|nr:uncharacterized protein BDR25DRAFT_36704 [Lindgomyces ingoldianus]KAF2470097.1 hypothetical protein BDR25DRAFT_36704 [Lindgomyces ingoldianus]
MATWETRKTRVNEEPRVRDEDEDEETATGGLPYAGFVYFRATSSSKFRTIEPRAIQLPRESGIGGFEAVPFGFLWRFVRHHPNGWVVCGVISCMAVVALCALWTERVGHETEVRVPRRTSYDSEILGVATLSVSQELRQCHGRPGCSIHGSHCGVSNYESHKGTNRKLKGFKHQSAEMQSIWNSRRNAEQG